MSETRNTSGVDAQRKQYDRALMRSDFIARWNRVNDTPPADFTADSYVEEYARNLTREGFVEMTFAPVVDASARDGAGGGTASVSTRDMATAIIALEYMAIVQDETQGGNGSASLRRVAASLTRLAERSRALDALRTAVQGCRKRIYLGIDCGDQGVPDEDGESEPVLCPSCYLAKEAAVSALLGGRDG